MKEKCIFFTWSPAQVALSSLFLCTSTIFFISWSHIKVKINAFFGSHPKSHCALILTVCARRLISLYSCVKIQSFFLSSFTACIFGPPQTLFRRMDKGNGGDEGVDRGQLSSMIKERPVSNSESLELKEKSNLTTKLAWMTLSEYGLVKADCWTPKLHQKATLTRSTVLWHFLLLQKKEFVLYVL